MLILARVLERMDRKRKRERERVVVVMVSWCSVVVWRSGGALLDKVVECVSGVRRVWMDG